MLCDYLPTFMKAALRYAFSACVFSVRFLHAVAFSMNLPWFKPINVISLKMQLHVVNACRKRLSQLSFNLYFKILQVGGRIIQVKSDPKYETKTDYGGLF